MSVRSYNFAKPPRPAGERGLRLLAWFQSAFRLSAKTWAKELPFTLEATVRDASTVRASDLLSKLPDGSIAYRIPIAGGRLPTLLVMPRTLLLAVIQGLLGESSEKWPDDHELTPVEKSLAEYFLQTLWVPYFKEAWPAAVQAVWEWPCAEASPQCSRFVPADESLTAFSYALRGPFGEAECCWLFRKAGLEELLGTIEPEAPTVEPTTPRIETAVRNLPLEFVVLLGRIELSVSELSELQINDVILLHQRVGEPLTAFIGDEPKFRGWPGRAGSSIAFRIESVLEE